MNAWIHEVDSRLILFGLFFCGDWLVGRYVLPELL